MSRRITGGFVPILFILKPISRFLQIEKNTKGYFNYISFLLYY